MRKQGSKGDEDGGMQGRARHGEVLGEGPGAFVAHPDDELRRQMGLGAAGCEETRKVAFHT